MHLFMYSFVETRWGLNIFFQNIYFYTLILGTSNGKLQCDNFCRYAHSIFWISYLLLCHFIIYVIVTVGEDYLSKVVLYSCYSLSKFQIIDLTCALTVWHSWKNSTACLKYLKQSIWCNLCCFSTLMHFQDKCPERIYLMLKIPATIFLVVIKLLIKYSIYKYISSIQYIVIYILCAAKVWSKVFVYI